MGDTRLMWKVCDYEARSVRRGSKGMNFLRDSDTKRNVAHRLPGLISGGPLVLAISARPCAIVTPIRPAETEKIQWNQSQLCYLSDFCASLMRQASAMSLIPSNLPQQCAYQPSFRSSTELGVLFFSVPRTNLVSALYTIWRSISFLRTVIVDVSL